MNSLPAGLGSVGGPTSSGGRQPGSRPAESIRDMFIVLTNWSMTYTIPSPLVLFLQKKLLEGFSQLFWQFLVKMRPG